MLLVAPVRERGLKYAVSLPLWLRKRRSRKGAWIEMVRLKIKAEENKVAPVRERGLKYAGQAAFGTDGRSLPQGSVD